MTQTTMPTIKLNDTDIAVVTIDGRHGVVLRDLNDAAGRAPHSAALVLRLRAYCERFGVQAREVPKTTVAGRARGQAARVLLREDIALLRSSFEDKTMKAHDRAGNLQLLVACERALLDHEARAKRDRQSADKTGTVEAGALHRNGLTEALERAMVGVTVRLDETDLAQIESVVRRVVGEVVGEVVSEELKKHAKLGSATTTLGYVQQLGH